MQNILGLIYGLVYGVSHVVPGLSGGTFLVIFGCYDLVCEAFALNFSIIKKHFFFLMFFGIGTVGGLVAFVHAITFLFNGYAIQTNLFFMGLILGGIPLIIKVATREEQFKPECLLPFILGLAVVISLFVMQKTGVFASGATQDADFIQIIRFASYSFIAAIAMILPGISGAFVLVAFGVYDIFIVALKELDLMVLVPAIAGILLGVVAGARLVLFIMKKYKLILYSAIIGMVIGSVVPLYPDGFGFNTASLAGIGCLLLGGWVSIIMGKKEVSDI